jgi:hypothetical protein
MAGVPVGWSRLLVSGTLSLLRNCRPSGVTRATDKSSMIMTRYGVHGSQGAAHLHRGRRHQDDPLRLVKSNSRWVHRHPAFTPEVTGFPTLPSAALRTARSGASPRR